MLSERNHLWWHTRHVWGWGKCDKNMTTKGNHKWQHHDLRSIKWLYTSGLDCTWPVSCGLAVELSTVGLNQHLECYSWWWGWAFRSPFQPKWWFFKLWFFKLWAVPLIPVPCQLGSKLHGETAESTSLGLCNSPGPHCWLFQVQMFWLTRGRKTRQPWGCVCPQLVGQWQGGWKWEAGAPPFMFLWDWVMVGEVWFPFAFQISSCSHLLWSSPLSTFTFPGFLSTSHFFFSSILSPAFCSFSSPQTSTSV